MWTSIVTPAPTVTGPINNPFLPVGMVRLWPISCSVTNAPSIIETCPCACNAPSEVAVPAGSVPVAIPTNLVVWIPRLLLPAVHVPPAPEEILISTVSVAETYWKVLPAPTNFNVVTPTPIVVVPDWTPTALVNVVVIPVKLAPDAVNIPVYVISFLSSLSPTEFSFNSASPTVPLAGTPIPNDCPNATIKQSSDPTGAAANVSVLLLQQQLNLINLQ